MSVVPEISKKFVELFAIKKKSELEKYCSNVVIAQDELVDLIQSSQRIGYVHSNRHAEYQPTEAQVTEHDLEALRTNDPAIRAERLPKLMNKTDNLFNVRKRLSAHLFLNASMSWHLFYFSLEDLTERHENHWIHGPHVHFVNDLWPQYRLEQLDDLLFSERKTKIANSVHIRFKHPENRFQFDEGSL